MNYKIKQSKNLWKCGLILVLGFLFFPLIANANTEILRPNGNGDLIEQTSFNSATNYENVDEEISDEDITYNYYPTGVPPKTDIYQLENYSNDSNSINSITIYGRAKGEDFPFWIAVIKTNGEIVYGDELDITANYITYSHQWLINPITTNAWTWEEINNLQAGNQIASEGAGEVRSTQVYIKVDFEAPPLPPEYIELIENATTGAEFYLDKRVSYGDILIITFLLLFLVFGILKFLTDFLVPKLINFKRK